MEALRLSKQRLAIHTQRVSSLSTARLLHLPQASPSTSNPNGAKFKPIKRPLWALYGLVGYGAIVVTYGTYLYLMVKNIPQSGIYDPIRQDDVSHVYSRLAKDYDSQVNLTEFLMGMGFLRRALAKRLHGNVLEVCVGTGRNLKYYPIEKCTSITFVDSNPEMLDQARKLFREKYPRYKKARFVLEDSAKSIPSPGGQGYDVIIQTMGLCSHHSPAQLLQNLESLCKKGGGKIILIEHGRSYYSWCNKILDYYALNHAQNWGCWWNRDIEDLLNESGLQLNKVSRYHLGTTYWIEASPKHKDSGA